MYTFFNICRSLVINGYENVLKELDTDHFFFFMKTCMHFDQFSNHPRSPKHSREYLFELYTQFTRKKVFFYNF